jgi:hypothetical protein
VGASAGQFDISILIRSSFSSYCSTAFYRVTLSALINVREITMLCLHFPTNRPNTFLAGLEQCSFPNLTVLRLFLDIPSASNFIYRHHHHIYELYVTSITRTFQPPCIFPELQRYGGSFHLMPFFVRGSPLHFISVSLNDTDDIEAILSVLNDTTVPLARVSVLSAKLDLGFFESLSRHAPNISFIDYEAIGDSLEIVAVWRVILSQMIFLMLSQPFTASLAFILPKFKGLEDLSLQMHVFSNDEDLTANILHFSDDYEVLQSWSQMCPSLKLCRPPASE